MTLWGDPCQELDGSRLLSASRTMVLGNKDSVVQGFRVQRRAQSSNWKEDERETRIVKE